MELKAITYHIFPVRLEKVKNIDTTMLIKAWKNVNHNVGMNFLERHLAIM